MEDNANQIKEIDKCFGSRGEKLEAPGRILIIQNKVHKVCRKGQILPRMLFLFNNILVYATIVVENKRYRNQRIIPLEEVEVEDFKDEIDPISKHGFVIRCPKKSFVVYAQNWTEKNKWVEYITLYANELRESKLKYT